MVLAIGLAFLIKWAIDRGTGSLYAGAIITALAVPGLLNAAGHRGRRPQHVLLRHRVPVHRRGPGVSGGGIGWQLWFGGFLTLLGAVNIAGASFGGYIVPIVLVALGPAPDRLRGRGPTPATR